MKKNTKAKKTTTKPKEKQEEDFYTPEEEEDWINFMNKQRIYLKMMKYMNSCSNTRMMMRLFSKN